MKRATYNSPLFKAADTGAPNNSAAPTGEVSPEKNSSGGQSEQRLSRQYIPVYRVELVRERALRIEPRRAVHNPDDVVAILKDELLKADRERLICLMLNAKNVVIGMEVVSIGTLTASLATPRELFKAAILASAAAVIVSHNHPLCRAQHKGCYAEIRIMRSRPRHSSPIYCPANGCTSPAFLELRIIQ